MAISKTRPNSLFASLALTEDGSSVSPRLFRNDATRPALCRGRRAGEPDSESAFPIFAFMRLFCPICTKQSKCGPLAHYQNLDQAMSASAAADLPNRLRDVLGTGPRHLTSARSGSQRLRPAQPSMLRDLPAL